MSKAALDEQNKAEADGAEWQPHEAKHDGTHHRKELVLRCGAQQLTPCVVLAICSAGQPPTSRQRPGAHGSS